MSEAADFAPPKQCVVGVDISVTTCEAADDGLSSLFPDATIIRERVLGLTKSLIAVRLQT